MLYHGQNTRQHISLLASVFGFGGLNVRERGLKEFLGFSS
jgi:hypothetical protein